MNVRACKRTALALLFAVAAGGVFGTGIAEAAQGDCSQPMSSGNLPVATDCLYILRTSVGLENCSPGCICAPKGSLPTTATDSLTCLRVATSQPATLNCPCLPPTTTSTTTSSTSTTTSTTTTTVPATTSTTTSTSTVTLPPTTSTSTTTLVGPTTTVVAPTTTFIVTTTSSTTTTTIGGPDACGNVQGSPACIGECPAGQMCDHIGNVCTCVPSTTPCSSASVFKCDGFCGAGSYCGSSGNACICIPSAP